MGIQRRYIASFCLFWVVVLGLVSCVAPSAPPHVRLKLSDVLGRPSTTGFERAMAPRTFTFPADHGPHPGFAAEWWYYTGNLETSDGRHFGYQLTFFRYGFTPQPMERRSNWATVGAYMAHFAVSDSASGVFYAFERFSRAAAGLAGAEGEPFRVWLDDWQARGESEAGTPMRLRAVQGDLRIDLLLEAGKPVVLQGNRGLSQKGAEPGNASYYYSLTRMLTSGMVHTAAGDFTVRGLSWMDREWSTSVLDPEQVGWDWFALQLDTGVDLMYYRLRRSDGSDDPYSRGILVAADGTTTLLEPRDVQISVTNQWTSPAGTHYPAGWRVQVSKGDVDLTIIPVLANQELPLTVTYWEGAVRMSGTAYGQAVAGTGFVELTGYADGQGETRFLR